MIAYRLYFRNPATGRFDGFEVIEAPDDAQAISASALLAAARTCELWLLDRLVHQWQAPAAA